jgi:hypothetical protein
MNSFGIRCRIFQSLIADRTRVMIFFLLKQTNRFKTLRLNLSLIGEALSFAGQSPGGPKSLGQSCTLFCQYIELILQLRDLNRIR